jgi:hypothetical protein
MLQQESMGMYGEAGERCNSSLHHVACNCAKQRYCCNQYC